MAKPQRAGIVYRDGRPFVYQTCSICGKDRLVREDSPQRRCKDCQPKGELSHNWKGGRQKDPHGYIWITLLPESPYIPMAYLRSKGTTFQIMEHRLIMAQHLGKFLDRTEVVHHINGVKDDNRIDNLKLTSRKDHRLSYETAYNEGLKAGLEMHDKSFEKQIKLLQWQIKELTNQLQGRLV